MCQTLSRLRFLLIFALASCFSPVAKAGSNPAGDFGQTKSLEFIQNRNQWHSDIKYRAALSAGDLYLLQNRWIYNFYDAAALPEHGHGKKEETQKTDDKLRAHAYSVTFLGANQKAVLTTERPTPGFRNYFIGNDPSHWASEVKAFEEVQYQEIYKGITAKIYEHERKLKYDFVLQPGADPKQIKMQYDGPESMQIVNGDLLIKTSVNTVTEQKPYAFQIVNGKQKEVACKFQLKDNVLSFVFPNGYKKKLPLIIDPTLIYSSYTGSTADNWGFTATYDNAGNIYSGGVVFYGVGGGVFPVTIGAYQVQQQGLSDIGIMKFNPNASGPASRVWATYLGGSGIEAPHSLVVNSQNELLVLGTTSSSNFPTPNGFDASYNGGSAIDPLDIQFPQYLSYSTGSDLFVSKFNSAGSALVGSTYLGGSGNDGLLTITTPLVKNYGDQFRGDITVDGSDNVYIASSTSSSNFPLQNAFQTSFSGGTNDAVVCKLSPNLNTLLWSTFLGGSAADAAFSIQVDSQNNIYVCGGTSSNNLAQTTGAWKTTNSMGFTPVDGFVSKITVNNNVPSLYRTSYIGTTVGQTSGFSGYDQTYFLQLDASNNVYVFGQSAGSYPVVPPTPAPPSFFSTANGHQFIQKLSADLTTSIFSTRFGSANGLFNISPTAFLVDNCERIFICGWGGNSNSLSVGYVAGNTNGLPVTPNAMKPTTDGNDFYLAQFSQNLGQLDYATFFGGNQTGTASGEHVDGGTSRFDKRGIVYHAVCAGCGANNSFPTTPNHWSLNSSNNCNNAAFKFDFAVTSAIAGGVQKVCANAGPTQITGASPPGGVWSGTSVTQAGIFTPSPALIGSHVLTYTTTVGACVSFATKTVTVVPETPATIDPIDSIYCIYSPDIALSANPTGGTWSGTGVVNGNKWSAATAGAGKHVISYTYTDSIGCVFVATTTVRVGQPVTPNAGPDEGICATSDPFQLTGATPAGGVWTGNGVSPNGIFTPNPSLIGVQTLTYTITQGTCVYTATKKVQVDPVPEVSPKLDYGNCGSDSTAKGFAPLKILFQNNTPIGKSFTWDFGDGTTSNEANPTHIYSEPGTYTVRLTTDFGRGCVRQSTVNTVTVIKEKIPNIITPNGDNLNDRFMPLVSCNPTNLRIYSRWGHLVYENENYNGEFKADNVSGGTYYYYIQDTQGRKWKGWLEIMK